MHTVSNARPSLRVTLGQHTCDTTPLAQCAISGNGMHTVSPVQGLAAIQGYMGHAAQLYATAGHRQPGFIWICHVAPVTSHLQKQSCEYAFLQCRPSTRPSCCLATSTCSGGVGQGATLQQTVHQLTMQRCGGCTAPDCDWGSGSLPPLAAQIPQAGAKAQPMYQFGWTSAAQCNLHCCQACS